MQKNNIKLHNYPVKKTGSSIKKEKIEKYAKLVSELKNHHAFFDLHVHPFEFFFSEINYTARDNDQRIYCTENASFKAPEIEDYNLDFIESGEIVTNARPDFFRLVFARQFQCTGQGVFEAYSKITGIENYALLLVAQSTEAFEKQLKLTRSFFPDRLSFLIAGGVPMDISNEEILQYLIWQKENYDIQLVKIHPNATGMNLNENMMVHRLEIILASCHELDLPVIVHAGRNSILKNQNSSDFALLDNLKKVNWGLLSSKVILAHGGIYDLPQNEINHALDDLKLLLDKYENLMYDISGLSFYQMMEIIKKIGLERAVYGSDAQYHSPLKSVAIFLQVVRKLGLELEQSFIKVAHTNPQFFLNIKRNENGIAD